MCKTNLQGVVGRIAGGVQHIQRAKTGIGRWMRHQRTSGAGVNEVVHAIRHRRYWRVEIVEREKMNTARALIANRQERVVRKLLLDAQRIFQAVWCGVDSVVS